MANRNTLELYWRLKGLERQMARTRHQKGVIEARNGLYTLRYYDTVLSKEGKLERPRLRHALGPCEGPNKLTDAQVKRLAEKFMGQVNNRESQPVALLSFGDYYLGPFQSHLNATSKNNQALFRSLMTNHVLPAIGTLTFREANKTRLQELINVKKAQGLSPNTIIAIRKVISAIFLHARDMNVIEQANPASRLVMPDQERVRPHHSMTPEMIAYAIGELEMPLSIMLLLSVCDSLGPAEWSGLLWRRMNLEDKPVRIDEQLLPPRSFWVYQNYARKEMKATKTKHRRRILPIPDAVFPMLLEWRRISAHRLPTDFVFAAESGEPIYYENANKAQFRTIGAALGQRVTWYSFRHSFATLFEEIEGGRNFDKKAIMGHSLRADITDGYTHVDFERLRRIVNAIAKLITTAVESQVSAASKVRKIR